MIWYLSIDTYLAILNRNFIFQASLNIRAIENTISFLYAFNE